MDPLVPSVRSSQRTLHQLVQADYQFQVPRYQRLYVWGEEQVATLLADLLTAAGNPARPYYLGSLLVVRTSAPRQYDLLDGQQRLTTLWLLSVALGTNLADFATTTGGSPRVAFAIRPLANAYFRAHLAGTDLPSAQAADPGLRQLTTAYARIAGWVAQTFAPGAHSEARKRRFTAFLRYRVYVVVTEVPASFDLNRLFEAINNRGIQLQHHEILKSRLLNLLAPRSVRAQYARLWNACATMADYLERATERELGYSVAAWYDRGSGQFDLAGLLATSQPPEHLPGRRPTLNQVLAGRVSSAPSPADSTDSWHYTAHPDAPEEERQPVRSILSFPQLLLHTLRIYLAQRRLPDLPRIHEKELLQSFTTCGAIATARQAQDFIELLWQVRFCFDAFVIKWVQLGDEETHVLKPLHKRNAYARGRTYYLQRQAATGGSGLELLQSMLYHSQQITTHYWLTPFLHQALTCRQPAELEWYLQRLDNHLFCTGDPATLAVRTRRLLNQEPLPGTATFTGHELDLALGVHFPHYWFYKLDYVLWHRLRDQATDPRWKSFRFTAKNSVEHISPQQPRPQDGHRLAPDLLDEFGNLVLVSRSINSEASNKTYLTKRINFQEKSRLDSLKSALIYAHPQWNDHLCLAHGTLMKQYLGDYFAAHS